MVALARNDQADRRRLRLGLIALGLFVVWTAVVHAGVGDGSRKSAWIQRPFGVWPAKVESITGTSDIQLSIFVTVGDGPVPLSSGAAGGILGVAGVGSVVDSGDSNNINGSRVLTGVAASTATAISVYVAGPIDVAPYDQFELAVYSDRHGAPDRLLATSGPGTLVADAWNSRPLALVLEPTTAYWLLFNTNGTNSAVNNPTLHRVVANPIDSLIRSWDIADGRQRADRIAFFGDNAPTLAAVLVVCAFLARRRHVAAAALLGGFGVALIVAWVLRETWFAPYGLYPSGHALRTAYVAVVVGTVFRGWAVRALFAVGCALVSISAIYGGGHYFEEILGGLLLGWGVAMVASALVDRPSSGAPARDEQVIDLRDRAAVEGAAVTAR